MLVFKISTAVFLLQGVYSFLMRLTASSATSGCKRRGSVSPCSNMVAGPSSRSKSRCSDPCCMNTPSRRGTPLVINLVRRVAPGPQQMEGETETEATVMRSLRPSELRAIKERQARNFEKRIHTGAPTVSLAPRARRTTCALPSMRPTPSYCATGSTRSTILFDDSHRTLSALQMAASRPSSAAFHAIPRARHVLLRRRRAPWSAAREEPQTSTQRSGETYMSRSAPLCCCCCCCSCCCSRQEEK